MSNYLGEVFTVSSRAVDDDDEDNGENEDQGTHSSSVLRWSPAARDEMEKSGNNSLCCSVLVIAVGQAATGFTQSHIIGEKRIEVIGVICSGMADKEKTSLSQHAFSDRTCYIYRVVDNPGIIVCLCNTAVLPEQSFSWTRQLFNGINTTNCYVAILGTSPVAQFVSETCSSDLPVPFLRSLKTKTFHGQPSIKYLEQPNTVKGLLAQVLTHCQMHSLPAVLFLCFTDVLHLDITTMKSFCSVLSCTPIRDIVQNVDYDKAFKCMLTLVEQQSSGSTLYI